MRKKIVLIISVIVLLISGLGYSGFTYVKNLPYKDIDAMIKRVNERVAKVPELTLYERDGYQANTLKLTQALYPEKTVEKNGTRDICENLDKPNIVCDSNDISKNYGEIYNSFDFPVEYDNKQSILIFVIHKYGEINLKVSDRERHGNTDVCEYAVNKKNDTTNDEVYLTVDKNNHKNNVIFFTINEFFIDCVSDEALRDQLLKQKYDTLEPVMKQWIEEYLYASKVFKKVKYTN